MPEIQDNYAKALSKTLVDIEQNIRQAEEHIEAIMAGEYEVNFVDFTTINEGNVHEAGVVLTAMMNRVSKRLKLIADIRWIMDTEQNSDVIYDWRQLAAIGKRVAAVRTLREFMNSKLTPTEAEAVIEAYLNNPF